MRLFFVVSLAVVFGSTPAIAAEYLTEVDSEVFTTTGTQAEITERAATCIAQTVKPGNVSTPVIIAKDAAAGVIVANNGFTYSQALMNWQIRTTLTFEAKDGRFRVRHINVERFINEWGPVGKWTGSKWQGVESAVKSVTASVAQCVQHPAQSANW